MALETLTKADSSFFADDDNEIWGVLSSGNESVDLAGVVQRFVTDHATTSNEEYWLRLANDAKSLGFAVDIQHQSTSLSHLRSLSSSFSSTSLPAAFETVSGKNHIEAFSKLIGVDSTEVVQLTFGALKDINTEKRLQSLLGTQPLFLKVLLYYCQQRSARLGIIVELLRGNRNDQNMEEMDRLQLIGGVPRGIFYKLISCACAPYHPPTRDHVLSLKDVGDEYFIQQALQTLADQRLLERELALEALLALFYARVSASCLDLTLLIMALHSCGEFFTTFESARLAQLAALLCAEAINLNNAGPSHIILKSPDATLTLLKNIIMNFSDQVDRRRAKSLSVAVVPVPESVVMLAFGLLLQIDERPDAMQCLQLANDCGAFDYLQLSFDSLLPSQTSLFLNAYQDTPGYDWQFANATPMPGIENDSQMQDIPAHLVVYTSIGLEMLNSTILALGAFMRDPENLAILCNLGATLFANQPLLCAEFWHQPGYIANLLDIAFDQSISSWKLLASLCYDAQSVNRAMEMISPEHLLDLLSTPGDDATLVLRAVAIMAQYNPSAIRHALLDNSSALTQILALCTHQNETMFQPVFNLLSSVIRDCPSWAKTAVNFFAMRSSHGLLSACFNSSKTTRAGALVIKSLVEATEVVCFSSSEQQVLDYLAVTFQGCIAGCHSLSNIFAFSIQPNVSYSDAYLILKATSDLVTNLRKQSLHTSIKVRESAFEARASMLEMFSTSTSFGLALSYFAGAPVSLSISLMLDTLIQDSSLVQLATDEYAIDDVHQSFGKWDNVLRKAAHSPIIEMIKQRLGDIESIPLDMAAIHNRNWSDGESTPLFAASAAISLLKTWSVEAEEFFLTQIVPVDFLSNTSPHKLLMSTATMPPIVRSDARLSHLWPACGLCTYDFLVHFIAKTETSGLDLPCRESLGLLAIVTAPAKTCGGLPPIVFDEAGFLYQAMLSAITDVTLYIRGRSDRGDGDFHIAIMFVKVLRNLVASDVSRGTTVLKHNSSALANALVDSVKEIASGSKSDESDRFAAECLVVLQLADMTSVILPELVALASFSGHPGIIRTNLVAQALEILSNSALAGKALPQVKDIFLDHSFHERRLILFRDSVISACKAMAKFNLVISSSKASSNLADPGLILQAFPSGESRVLKALTILNPYDIKAATKLIYSQVEQSGGEAELAADTKDLTLAIMSVDKHVEAVSAWALFVKAWTSNGMDISRAFVDKVAKVLVDVMEDLAQLSIEVEKEVPMLSSRVDSVLGAASDLLLNLINCQHDDTALTKIELPKLVSMMQVASVRSVLLPARSELLTNLMALSAVVVQKSAEAIDSNKVMPIVRGELAIRNNLSAFRSSLMLLASMIGVYEKCKERSTRATFVSSLSQTSVVKALVDEVVLACNCASEDKPNGDDEQVANIISLLTILLTLSNMGEVDSSLIALFLESNLSTMLLGNDMLARAVTRWTVDERDSHYRGYTKTSKKTLNDGELGRMAIILSGSIDPVHKVWRLAMSLLTSLLRVCSIHGQSQRLQKLALNFIGQYEEVLRSCLAQCSAVRVNALLTRNLVYEADETLALFSSLGTKSDRFLDVTLLLVGSLTKFLGAIGSSRFLFNLVRDVEAANQEQESQFDNLVELHPSFSGGVENARFEAVRYAHYGRSAFAMVTDRDNQKFSSVRGILPHGSELERTCYKAINNDFCAELEVHVAHCLTHALTFLSKIHPASSCFTRFSKEDKRFLNPYNIVKTGAIIAADSDGMLKFARVLRIDTVRRCWMCCLLDNETGETSTEVTIAFDNLAGVEDVTKQRNFFPYVAAPDAAAQMESGVSGSASNLGHLILALQWCRQGGIGIDHQIRINLAESAASLLATEIAIHRQLGTDKITQMTVSKSVNDQLFDLFDSCSRVQGLIDCIEQVFMYRIRNQLKGPLDIARKERAEKRQQLEERLSAISGSNPWR